MSEDFEYLMYLLDQINDKTHGMVDDDDQKDSNKIDNQTKDTDYLYRGHGDDTYLIQPSIFRVKEKSAHDIYSYIITKHSNEFISMKPLEVLSKMQHLEISTSLLDITQNPLVALFFAVDGLSPKNDNKKHPELLIFPYEKSKLKRFDSDTVKLLSCLPLLEKEDQDQLLADAVNEYLIDISIKRIFDNAIPGVKFERELQEIISFVKEIYYLNSRYKQSDRLSIIIQSLGNIKTIDKRENDICYCIKRKEDKLKNIHFYIHHLFNTSSDGSFDISKCEICVFYHISNDFVRNGYCLSMRFKFKRNKKGKVLYTVVHYTLFDRDGKIEKTEPFLKSYSLYGLFDISTQNNKKEVGTNNNLEYESLFSCVDDNDRYRSKPMEELYYKVKEYCPDFRRCTKPLDIINGTYVYPLVNTDRMRAQQGLFAIFGLSQYWNFKKYLEHQIKKKDFYDAVFQFLDNNITAQKGRKNKKIKAMEDELFGVRRIPIDIGKFSELSHDLKKLGVDKETLGCSMKTTFNNCLDN